ncbi:uncharacterized protein LOC117648178 [Thrips palmi]|uniref:Uncharacterized protein LOC117648178 n=1 Tax=Thrips palmi TaxID=161013 RepID=A0A6P8ZCI7_THRPL|nr:uncharacterized protein LOC117648178 [Thrips palmi]
MEARAARTHLEQLHQKIVQRQKDIADVTLQLADMRSTHRECLREYEFDGLVEHPDQYQWKDKTLRLSAKAMHSRKRVEHFIKKLATAPCMKTLSLFLQEYIGGVPPSLKLAQDALSKAPVHIQELCVTFGSSSKEAVLALVEKTRDHLERLALTLMYDARFTDDELRRLWGLVGGSNIKVLALSSPELVRKVQFPFRTSRLQLERLELGDLGDCKHPTVLGPLIRAASATLRVVQLPSTLVEGDRMDVFEALGECSNLEEASVPCYRYILALQSCAKLGRLGLQCVDKQWSLRPNADTNAVVELLGLKFVKMRLRGLTLSSFCPDRDRAVIGAVSALKNLRSLTLNTNMQKDALVILLRYLPCLEELHLLRRFSLTSEIVRQITPRLLPKLRLLELDCDDNESECNCSEDDEDFGFGGCGLPHAGWRPGVDFTVKRAFEEVNPDLTLIVAPSTTAEKKSCSSEGSDVESDDGLEKEALKQFELWQDEEEESSEAESNEGSETEELPSMN